MPALTIKNIPDALYRELKTIAQLHRRSINSEVIVCLEKTLMPTKISADERLKNARSLRNQIKSGVISIDDIENAINDGRP